MLSEKQRAPSRHPPQNWNTSCAGTSQQVLCHPDAFGQARLCKAIRREHCDIVAEGTTKCGRFHMAVVPSISFRAQLLAIWWAGRCPGAGKPRAARPCRLRALHCEGRGMKGEWQLALLSLSAPTVSEWCGRWMSGCAPAKRAAKAVERF